MEGHNTHLDELIETYKKDKICLFTGAGVSFTSSTKFQTPGWWDLLELIYRRGRRKFANGKKWKSFADIRTDSEDAWNVVDAFIDLFGSEDAFQKVLVDALIENTGKDTRYKRLPIAYLNGAPTLNALIAFCSQIKYFNKHQCLEPNDKIGVVLTLNYDWYFEGGATQKYNAAPFKPMATDKSDLMGGRLPVYHLHGYIPHEKSAEKRVPLTMSSSTYQALYHQEDTWVKNVIKSQMTRHTTLFVGTSFDDVLIVEYLQQLAKNPKWPRHFFLAKEGTIDGEKLNALEKANVYPIWVTDYDEIPDLLGQIYSASFEPDDLEVWHRKEKQYKTFTFVEYWKLLLLNKK